MILLQIIKGLIKDVMLVFRKQINYYRLQNQFPTCKFYPGAQVDNSSFEGYNVIFKDVVISSCRLGAHSYVQKKSTIFNTEIGRYCSIASYVSIAPGIHKIDGVSTHPSFYLKNIPLVKTYSDEDTFPTSAKVTIGHDVWIGERALIVDGIIIGTGAIIAAGAVVTKNVEPYSIVGGIPAKHIKYRFDLATIEKLIESRWWENSEEWYDANYKKFLSPELLIKS
jgi:acetyltransferase-like isoleucine patch superfamily enzyme